MKKEGFAASEQVWERLVVSINTPAKNKTSVQLEAVIALSVAVCCMIFINYTTIKRSDINDFIYTNYRQLADPSDRNFSSDAWTKISANLQKEE